MLVIAYPHPILSPARRDPKGRRRDRSSASARSECIALLSAIPAFCFSRRPLLPLHALLMCVRASGSPRLRSIALAVAVSAGLAFASCRDLDVVTGAYDTLADAQRAGAIERGWIPRGLPSGAHEIREAHDLDRHRQWGLFNFSAADGDALRATLRPEELSVAGLVCDMPARIEWWPPLLRGSLDPEKVNSSGLKIYGAREGDLMVAVNWPQGRAYYWTK